MELDLVNGLELARTLEDTDDRSIVTCGADGQVLSFRIISKQRELEFGVLQFSKGSLEKEKLLREACEYATILECGKVEMKLLARHNGIAHKLANVSMKRYLRYRVDWKKEAIQCRTTTKTDGIDAKPNRYSAESDIYAHAEIQSNADAEPGWNQTRPDAYPDARDII
ncbi:hypothetical protein Tco_0250743 [Tanacetum coccineum]